MLSRIDLADTGSPEGLVRLILKQEPSLPIPVPLDELCRKLDIEDIVPLTVSEFEGALFTDRDKSKGIIAYNDIQPRQRRRFTVAHELGHFLIPTHVPDADGQFLCTADDLNIVSITTEERRVRIESEANRFAALLLMPPPFFRKDVGAQREPSINGIVGIARRYDTSKEATARWYIQFREEPCAIIIGHGEEIVRYYKNDRFPFITCLWGDKAPDGLLALRNRLAPGDVGEWGAVLADDWVGVERGRPAPELYAQIQAQRDCWWLALLQIEQHDDDEDENEAGLRESWEVTFRK
jgi:hypothetical protein